MSEFKDPKEVGEHIIKAIDLMDRRLLSVDNVPLRVSVLTEVARESIQMALVELTAIEKREVPENEREERVDDWPHAQQRPLRCGPTIPCLTIS